MIKEIIDKLINRNKKFIEDSIKYENKYSFLNTHAYNEELEYKAKQDFIKANYPVDYEDYLKALEQPNLNNKLNQYVRFFIELFNNEEIDNIKFLELIDYEEVYRNDWFKILTKYHNIRFNNNIIFTLPFIFKRVVDKDCDKNLDMETKIKNLSIIYEGLDEEEKLIALNKIEDNIDKENELEEKTYLMLKLKGKLKEKDEPKKKVIKI